MFYEISKRLLDIAGATLGLVLFSPVILTVIIVSMFSSEGPVFYAPVRVGRSGKEFKMLKFRSMYMYKIDGKLVHAKKYLEKNPKLMREYQRSSYKLYNDPRITPLGHFLRRYSIDELPQLVNVLIGDMSLVGPRAYQKDELEHQQKIYPNTKKYVKIILNARPGASGPWQTSGRSFINFDKRVEMDAEYVKRKSLAYDLWIIVKTPISMANGKGAI